MDEVYFTYDKNEFLIKGLVIALNYIIWGIFDYINQRWSFVPKNALTIDINKFGILKRI